MTKILLPVLVGVFIGAFTVELVRRNDPALAESLKARAKKLADSLGPSKVPPQRLATTEGNASWKHSG